MVSPDPFQAQLDHLIRMARIPGFKDHAWYRAKELSKSSLFEGMADRLVEAMKKDCKDAGNAQKGV